ncbi:MAG: hypothetical protein AAFV80_09190 [Bacteroidota bacterium]
MVVGFLVWSAWKERTQGGADDREFEWCIVGNIVDRRYYGQEKEIRSGTKHFRSGTKVYCIPSFADNAYVDIRVIGKHRKNNRRIILIMQTRHIKDFRVRKVYHPKLRTELASHPFYSEYRIKKLEVKELERMAAYLNTLTVEADGDG